MRREIVAAPVRQEDVGEEQADLAVELRADPERLARRRGMQGPVPLCREDAVGREPEWMFVVDDQDGPERSGGLGDDRLGADAQRGPGNDRSPFERLDPPE